MREHVNNCFVAQLTLKIAYLTNNNTLETDLNFFNKLRSVERRENNLNKVLFSVLVAVTAQFIVTTDPMAADYGAA